jgi:hypothetical protein
LTGPHAAKHFWWSILTERLTNEKNVSAIETQKGQYARIQEKNGNKGWAERHQATAEKGPENPYGFRDDV